MAEGLATVSPPAHALAGRAVRDTIRARRKGGEPREPVTSTGRSRVWLSRPGARNVVRSCNFAIEGDGATPVFLRKCRASWHRPCNPARSIVQNPTSTPLAVHDLLDKVVTAYGEIDRRFAPAGGVGALLGLYEQVRRELDRVSYEELDRMTLEIKTVIEALLKMDYELRRVHNLKVAFDGGIPGEPRS